MTKVSESSDELNLTKSRRGCVSQT